jgi:hypothetical protein
VCWCNTDKYSKGYVICLLLLACVHTNTQACAHLLTLPLFRFHQDITPHSCIKCSPATLNAWVRRFVLMAPKQGLNRASFLRILCWILWINTTSSTSFVGFCLHVCSKTQTHSHSLTVSHCWTALSLYMTCMIHSIQVTIYTSARVLCSCVTHFLSLPPHITHCYDTATNPPLVLSMCAK